MDLADLNPLVPKQADAFFLNYEKVRDIEMRIIDHGGPEEALAIVHRSSKALDPVRLDRFV
ncbi:MAG TPA: hypothetical protein VMG40_19240 [Bryobacteraceae bacterium]|nr:hypothetical protein [Bryobacteraceae bacterium]